MGTLDKIYKILDEIEREECCCDLLYGYFCNIHSKVAQIKKLLNIIEGQMYHESEMDY